MSTTTLTVLTVIGALILFFGVQWLRRFLSDKRAVKKLKKAGLWPPSDVGAGTVIQPVPPPMPPTFKPTAPATIPGEISPNELHNGLYLGQPVAPVPPTYMPASVLSPTIPPSPPTLPPTPLTSGILPPTPPVVAPAFPYVSPPAYDPDEEL